MGVFFRAVRAGLKAETRDSSLEPSLDPEPRDEHRASKKPRLEPQKTETRALSRDFMN
jgi:hypothetical protein